MERVILHVDANCFYASVECLYHPELRGRPVAVCGDPDARHGIVLTANYPAKGTGVRVGQAIWQARRLCPELVILAPHYDLYLDLSQRMRRMWADYSDRVEPFGLDESWIDLTERGMTLDRGAAIADEIRRRARAELGITVSVGVADNKVFAKLGSDMKKPDGTTLLLPAQMADRVWPLPVNQLLYVGPATYKRLGTLGIRTIGDLARADTKTLERLLGKAGLVLQVFAQGQDRAPVAQAGETAPLKSVSNSVTTPRDIATLEDAKCVYYLLAESVAARMRGQGLKTRCLSVAARDTDLCWHSCQMALPAPTNVTSDIARGVYQLFLSRFAGRLPLRSAGVCCAQLTPESAPEQLSFDQDVGRRMKQERLDKAVDALRGRYGSEVIRRGVVMLEPEFTSSWGPEEDLLPASPFFA